VIRIVVLAAVLIAAGPRSETSLPVPIVAQAPERCGPAALTMVLRYYGAPDTAVAEAERAYDPVLHGTLITDLAAAARRAGFDAVISTPSEDSLRALLTQRVPPVLLYLRGVGPMVRQHYGVLVGWDPDREHVIVHEGGPTAQRISAGGLLRRWRAAGGQALVVRPRS